MREETRYYLSSLPPGTLSSAGVRWRLENSCRWVLDVVFREVQSRARCGDAARNFSALRRIGLNLLKNDEVRRKEPIRGKRIYAALGP